MRKIKMFDGKRHVYDTTKSTELGKRSIGAYGDPAGYEEALFQNRQGFYFVLGVGGIDSPYPTEDIKPISAEEAEAFQA